MLRADGAFLNLGSNRRGDAVRGVGQELRVGKPDVIASVMAKIRTVKSGSTRFTRASPGSKVK